MEEDMKPDAVDSLKVVLLGLALLGSASQGAGQDGAQSAQEEWKAPVRASKKKNPVPADEKSTARGKEIYTQNCHSCHGPTGKGDGPAAKDLPKKARDLADPKTVSETDGALFWKISEGRAPMTSYEKLLSEEDRWHVV